MTDISSVATAEPVPANASEPVTESVSDTELKCDGSRWWRDHGHEFGLRIMDCSVSEGSEFAELLANGREEFARIRQGTGLTVGSDRSVLEVGCGVGRVTHALAEHFGFALGIDVSPHLIETARNYNHRSNLVFEPSDGKRLAPRFRDRFDTILSNEVFQYLDRPVVKQYLADARALLVDGGELVFEWNCQPMSLRTRASIAFRHLLHLAGKTSWRGWPTAWGFRRRIHSVNFIRRELEANGFTIELIDTSNPQQAWVRAVKG